MRIKVAIGIGVAVLFTAGCSSMIRPESPEPALYRLEYEPARVECDQGFDRGVRVSNFTTASPYNRTQMVVLGTGRQVMFSRNFQWVASPGTMLTGKLQNDLKRGDLFPEVVAAGDLSEAPLEIIGNIAQFACERTDSKCEAVLSLEIELKETGVDGKTVFQETYRMRSDPFAKEDSALFAEAMSRLTGRLSEKLRKDLCKAAGMME